MTPYRILLVDDEQDILEFLSYNLTKEGYEVAQALSGKQALEIALDFRPDLIVLDLMMPEMDGIETCAKIRTIPELKHCLITFLTARAEDYSLIAGLEAGADDYISKPIKPKVFSTKVAALLRRIGNTQDHTTSESDFSINQESYVVVHKGVEIILPKKEFELLNLLYSKKGKVFTRDEILSKVWGNDVVVGDRTIDVHIRKLREKLGNERIKTLKGIGYKLEE